MPLSSPLAATPQIFYIRTVTKTDGGNITIVRNRKALHDYHILDRWEAGLALAGSEVKSLREGKANLRDAYGKISEGEIYLVNAHISPYDPAARDNHDPRRERKLLLHRREIRKLTAKVMEKGFTLIPLSLYFTPNGKAKVELALATGKKQYDKRAAIKEKDVRRAKQRGDDY